MIGHSCLFIFGARIQRGDGNFTLQIQGEMKIMVSVIEKGENFSFQKLFHEYNLIDCRSRFVLAAAITRHEETRIFKIF